MIFWQKTTKTVADGGLRFTRSVTIKCPRNGYGGISEIIGTEYTVVFWHEQATPLGSVGVSNNARISSTLDEARHATIVTLQVDDAHTTQGVTIQVGYDAPF